MKIKIIILATLVAVSGCVSNKAIQTVQTGDEQKSCDALKSELAELGAEFEEAKKDSGVTGKNVGLAIVFWPGIIVNEVRANKNQDSLDARVSHLSGIYDRKCSETTKTSLAKESLKSKLLELKELHEQGLIDDEEYKLARARALEGADVIEKSESPKASEIPEEAEVPDQNEGSEES
jgi:hypothetical protein